MREILFRGKRTDRNEWVYGYYLYNPIIKKTYILVPNTGVPSIIHYEVDPCTIGHYTYCGDYKNGDKIYVDDVIENEYGVFLVVWDDMELAFSVRHRDSLAIEPLVSMPIGSAIIGNIHDSPGLRMWFERDYKQVCHARKI